MNEELEGERLPEKGRLNRDAAVAVVLSAILGYMSFTSFLYTCPLLVFGAKYGKKEYLKVAGAEALIQLGYGVYLSWGAPFFFYSLATTLSIPVSLLAAGTIWLTQDRYRVEMRLLLSFVPALFFYLGIGLYLQLDGALLESVYGGYKDVFAYLLSGIFEAAGVGFDLEYLYFVMITLVAMMVLPMTLAAVCVTNFFYSSMSHSKESDWEDRVEQMEFSQDLIWGLVAIFALNLLSRFVSMPVGVKILLVSLLLSALLVYGAQGFSVLFSWMRRVSPMMRSFSLLLGVGFFAMIVPGLNIIVLLGLPLIGILENFFNLKKRKTQ